MRCESVSRVAFCAATGQKRTHLKFHESANSWLYGISEYLVVRAISCGTCHMYHDALRDRQPCRVLRGKERVLQGQLTDPSPLYHRNDLVDRPRAM